MREVGKVEKGELAQRFVDYLLAQGIEGTATPQDRHWVVWVYDDDELAMVRADFERFLNHPYSPAYVSAQAQGRDMRVKEEEEAKRSRHRQIHMRQRWQRGNHRQIPVTMTLIAISVGVALLTGMGSRSGGVESLLTIASYERVGNSIRWYGLHDVMSGQVWRLVTPIFLHYGILHLLFNMMWLYQLGGLLELRLGRLRYLLMILAIAVISNLAQYYSVAPNFGGMSGVDYGLLGFMWAKGRFDPRSGLGIDPNTMMFMMVWLALGFVGFMNMANGAHLGGLLSGVAFGALPALRRPR